MLHKLKILTTFFLCFVVFHTLAQESKISSNKTITIYLIGDSTVADYTGDYDPGKDYMKVRFPIAGWGQEFQPFFIKDSIKDIAFFRNFESIKVDDRARGGRSTRTFFQEGRWRNVYENLKPKDLVLIQFGHNDASEKHTERFVNIEGYKEFLRLFVSQSLAKGAYPIILSPVARNYPWKNGVLKNVHGEYPKAAKEVADEFKISFIDLNQNAIDYFNKKGKDFVSKNYFLNLDAGLYEAYPEGKKDDTHFQIKGAQVVASLVFDELKKVLSNPIFNK